MKSITEIADEARKAREALEKELHTGIPQRKVFDPKEILEIITFAIESNRNLWRKLGYWQGYDDGKNGKPMNPEIENLRP